MTDAQVEAACATLKRAIEAAENSNQAGEDFVMAAAAGPALLEAVDAMIQAEISGSGASMAKARHRARAAIAKATGREA